MSHDRAPDRSGSIARFGLWMLSNGPAVVTVLGSAVVAILASVVNFTAEELLQVLLLLMTLFATSLLTDRLVEGRRSRQQLADVATNLETVVRFTRHENVSLDDVLVSRRQLPELESRLLGATQIMISGGSLSRLANEYRSLFERLLSEGCRLRFVMTNPMSAGAEFLSNEVSYESRSLDAYRAYIEDAAESLADLARRFPDDCETRLFDAAPPFSLMIIVKPDSASAQVELYTLGLPARDRPILLTTTADSPRLCALFTEQFERLWVSPRTKPIRLQVRTEVSDHPPT